MCALFLSLFPPRAPTFFHPFAPRLMDDQSAHRQHLISVAFVPLQAWRTLALHYRALGKNIHWDATDRFEVHYRRAVTSDPPEPMLYTELEPTSGSPPCASVCVREWSLRKNAEPKQLPLMVFATHAMVALRALLADAFAPSTKRVSPRKWPVFLRLLVFRITVQQHSRPWWSNCKEGTEDYAVAALHQLVARLLYNHKTASTEWIQGAPPLWLQYHAEYEHMQKADKVLTESRSHWQRRAVQLARAPLELYHGQHVRLTNTDVQIYIHPYQLSLAIYAVLSQAVHLIYVAQHESRAYGVYYASRTAPHACTMCHSQWHMGKATVGQTARALYERLVMMLRSSSASTSNVNSLVSSSSGMSSDQSLYVCNSTCHWCVLLRAMCLAVMRQLQVRKLARQHQRASALPADDNYVCATIALQVQLHQYDESGVNGNSHHQQCTWCALPIEPMLQQALRCFQEAPLLLQQFHTLTWYKTTIASAAPSLPRSLRLWRVRNRVARVVPMCYGGAAQTLALYKTLESLWWIGAWVILPRVLCAVERHVREFLTLQQACAIAECIHEPCHYTRGQDVIEIHDQFAHTVSYCISLACRYYDAHSRVGWSDAPMRVSATTSDQYAQSQPLLAVYATLEALLTCITRPVGEEQWLSSVPLMTNTCTSTSSMAPFLGPAVRHYAQCRAMKDLNTVYSVENNTTHYQEQSLLQWWVVPYNAEFTHNVDEDEHQCTLGDLQHTCRIATSACVKRIAGDQPTFILSGSMPTMVDRAEADSSAQLGACGSLASMMVVSTHSAEMIWNAFSSEEECRAQMNIGAHRPTLCSEFLAAVPTCPPPSLHYAVVCGTPESLLLLRELNNARTNTIQCARDICTMPDVRECTPVPEYLHFLHDLLLGDDKQLARAAQWLYTRLFYEPRARDQSIEREGDLASLCLQEGDAALRFLRLLPMMLESVVASNPEQSAESVFTALVVPYREVGALRQEYKQRRRKQPVPTAEDVDLCWTEESSQSPMDDVRDDIQPMDDEQPSCVAHNKPEDDAKDLRVLNLTQCSLHSNLLALLSPYHMRIGVSYHTLQQVWCALLDSRELWIAHHQLACVMVEWLSIPRVSTRTHAPYGHGGFPTWYVWRVMRAAYVRWRAEEQKRKCPSLHDGRLCYREQKLTGIPDSGRWMDQREVTFTDVPAKAGQQRRLTARMKRSPTATSWCLCRQCAQVSCTQPVPAWVYQRFSASSSGAYADNQPYQTIPGFWHINMELRFEPELLRMVHEHAYVHVRDYSTGPARNTGVHCNIDVSRVGVGADGEDGMEYTTPRRVSAAPAEPLPVYDPLCPVPPYPDSPEDVQRWKEYTFQPTMKNTTCAWDTDVAHIPSCSLLMPDLQPPHLLLYAFACDPSVSTELRAEIFKSVRAWRGFQRYEMRPARPPTNTLVALPVDSFCTGAEQAHEWCQEQARQFCKTSGESGFQERHRIALSANEVDHYNASLQWMSSGLKPLTFEQLLHDRLMPLRTVTHLALFSDILARLPFHKSETPEVVQQLIQQRMQNNDAAYRIPRNASRGTLIHEALGALYEPSVIHAALLNLCYKGQTLPLLWHTSPYNNNSGAQPPVPSETVLRDMRDWINPKVSYTHDTMPVYDLPMSMQYDPKVTLGSCSVQYKDPIDRIGPFGLCMPEVLHTAVTNPITHVHGDLVSLDRLENSLGRNSGVVCRNLNMHPIDAWSSVIDFSSCTNGHPHLASPGRSPRMGNVPVPLLMHGPLVTNTTPSSDVERTPQYERIVDIKWYTPGEIGQCVYAEQHTTLANV